MSVPTHSSPEAKRAVRLVEFNLHAARFAHRSWYEEELGTQIPSRAEPHISAWLLRKQRLEADMDWDLQEPQKRLWLLDRAGLERLAFELALAMHREWLAQLIDSARLRAVLANVDAGAVRFVVEAVPAGSFHYQSPVVTFDTELSPEKALQLQEHGARTLMGLLQPTWRAVRGRAQLFFDRALQLADVPALDPDLCRRALELICQRLIPRRFPEWAWCF